VTHLPGSGPNVQNLYYTYDNVGNITAINQYASTYSGLGGGYSNTYTYDNQYRLIRSVGTSSNDFRYDFSASYSPSGRLGHNSCGANIVDKKLKYGYDEDFLTHQPRVIFDTVTSLSYNLYWDANGNLHEMSNCKLDVARFHDWDEENRLHAVVGPSYAGLYGYDGNGNRLWKLTGSCSNTSQNGGTTTCNAYIDDAVLYPNPYITITPQGYTKHYYLGSERIATALGEGGWNINPDLLSEREKDVSRDWFGHFQTNYPFGRILMPQTANEDITGDDPLQLQYECINPIELGTLHISYSDDILSYSILDYVGQPVEPSEFFYTHSDHLGSASWITNRHAEPVQYIHYAPYGELLANQTPYGYDERYKFTGKERDAETGYDYFGARFLAQQLGIWLSVDPLAGKYPWISPYAYCSWNPVKYVDPNGKWVETAWDIVNVMIDVASLASNIENGNTKDAIIDGVGLVMDVAAVLLPVPGGAGTALKSVRAADKAYDAAKATKTATTGIKATANNYRLALQKATGKLGKGFEAHHTLPQKYRKRFEDLGINIDEPGNVVWRKSEGHRAKSAKHTKAWDDFFNDPANNNCTKEQIMDYRKKVEDRIWHNQCDSPVE